MPPAPENLHRLLGEPNRLNSPNQPQKAAPSLPLREEGRIEEPLPHCSPRCTQLMQTKLRSGEKRLKPTC